MGKRKPKPKCWHFSVGKRPHTVEVFEKKPGGILYARAWDKATKRRVEEPLNHRDQEQAIEYAQKEAKKLREGQAALQPGALGAVLAAYLANQTPKKVKTEQDADHRRNDLWLTHLGATRRIASLGKAEWETFIRDRGTGAIAARGRKIEDPAGRKPVGPRTVDADLVFLVSVFNWACQWNVGSRKLLDHNPWGVPGPGVKRALERPKNDAPSRPMATYDDFLEMRKVASRVMMRCRKDDPGARLVELGQTKDGRVGTKRWMRPSYLRDLLDLVEDTGRRIGAIVRFWYSDIVRENGVIQRIRWRPFKKMEEHETPVSKRTRAVLERILSDRPGIGDRAIFPARIRVNGDVMHIDKRTATEWFAEAEKMCGLRIPAAPGHRFGAWHKYRHKWANERKGHEAVDAARAGGWKRPDTLRNVYWKTDDAAVEAVINEPRKIRRRRA